MNEAEQCDRLVVMTNGRVVAEGSVTEIVRDSRVTVVETTQWAGAFTLIEKSGAPAALVGRTLRTPNRTPGRGVPAARRTARQGTGGARSLEERFLQLTLAGGHPARQ